MKKRLLLLLLVAVAGLSFWYSYRILTFQSDHDWKSLSVSEIPTPVLDTLRQIKTQKTAPFFVIMDETLKDQVSLGFQEGQLFLIKNGTYIIKCKDKTIKISQKDFHTPYVFYQGKMYCTEDYLFSSADPFKTFRVLALDF